MHSYQNLRSKACACATGAFGSLKGSSILSITWKDAPGSECVSPSHPVYKCPSLEWHDGSGVYCAIHACNDQQCIKTESSWHSDARLLVSLPSCSRVAESNPNWGNVYMIRSCSHHCFPFHKVDRERDRTRTVARVALRASMGRRSGGMLMRSVDMAVSNCSGTGSTFISPGRPRPAGSGLIPGVSAPNDQLILSMKTRFPQQHLNYISPVFAILALAPPAICMPDSIKIISHIVIPALHQSASSPSA